MKLLTTLTVAALMSVSGAAIAGGGHGSDKLIVINDSRNAIAVAGEMTAKSGKDQFWAKGKRANAGSVVVDGCQCYDKTIVLNKSRNAIAVGAANAGSVVLSSY